MESDKWKYYVSWVRHQKKDLYLLWRSGGYDDAYWADETGRVPAFCRASDVVELADRLGVDIENQPPLVQDMDVVCAWLNRPHKQVPCKDCLGAWHCFDDLATGVHASFRGWRRGPVRNRVFDKLYFCMGFWRPTADQLKQAQHWKPEEQKTLRRILSQGFRLWKKYVYEVSEQPA